MTHTYKVGDKGKTRGFLTYPETQSGYEITAIGLAKMTVLVHGDEVLYPFSGKHPTDSSMDLLSPIPPKRRIQWWVNFFQDAPCMGPFMTKEGADASYNVIVCCAKALEENPPVRIACIYIDIEEGEGL